MPPLPELLASESVHQALATLDAHLAHSNKTRVVESVHNYPHLYGSMARLDAAGYTILVDEEAPNAEGQLVHEICHPILWERGYFISTSSVLAQGAAYLLNGFDDAVLHAEVFRLMETFGVDMNDYYAHKQADLLQKLQARQFESEDDYAHRQQDMLVFFDAFLMGASGQAVRDALHDQFLGSFAVCTQLRAGLPAAGLTTWQAADTFGVFFKNRLVTYCDTHDLDLYGAFWHNLVLRRPQQLFPNPRPLLSPWRRVTRFFGFT
jgi:hypothetical protein